jgi:hypothetical protein
MNIIPKHDGHETVANFDSQYLHCDESEEIAAPQFGQLRFCAFIVVTSARILRPRTSCPHWLLKRCQLS